MMIDLKYSLVIEATDDQAFFAFYSPDLEGFTGVGSSIEDCVQRAKAGMEEHLSLLREQALPIPRPLGSPTITIRDEEKLRAAC